MKIVSTQSLETLRSECGKDPQLIHRSLDSLIEGFNLNLVSSNYSIEEFPELYLPAQKKNKDLENCRLLSEAFSGLHAIEATDERLWVTLCFGIYSDYVNTRWPVEKAQNPKNHVQNHWFATTARNRMRDNAISRLWWMAHIAKKVPNISMDEVLQTLFFNSDYRTSLLERSSSGNSANVVASILSISQKALEDGIEFDRQKFRKFMRSVNFIGKRTSLPSLSIQALEELLSPYYYDAYEVDRK